MNDYHIPVMPEEVIQFLGVQKDHWYIDCNLGGGGHTDLILEAGGKVIGIDMDQEAIRHVADKHGLTVQEIDGHLEVYSDNLILYQSNFAKIDEVIVNIKMCHPEFTEGSLVSNEGAIQGTLNTINNSKETDITKFVRDSSATPQNDNFVSGVLFDLGLSSHQLEKGERGFSFMSDAPLDMRMDQSFGATAADLINGLYEKELADLVYKLGEEPFSRKIAKAIVNQRNIKKIETTRELAEIISSSLRRQPGGIHPATRVFQALRIAVNDELGSLTTALPKAFELLSPGGKMVAISFHSLEDRIVKNHFKEWETQQRAVQLTDKPLSPTPHEIGENSRSRSAKLRAIQKV
jgi:16S rRNA (cytosine1402-N4)-methyltransferase